MKRIAIFLALALLTAAFAGCGEPAESTGTQSPVQTEATEGTWMTMPNDRQLTAQQYFVYDCEERQFLTISGAETEVIYPASVTKIFTAYVALQYLKPSQKITAGDVLDLVAAGSSVAEIEEGDTLTVEKLVEAMLLPSGNDAAYILADAAGKAISNRESMTGTAAVAAFVAEMNAQAKALGMTGTNFANPDGIHSDTHRMNFRDLATLGMLAMEDPVICKYAAVSEDQMQLGGQSVQWHNTNALIDPASEYYCPYAIGLKTGQTPRAGSCLLSAFEYKGRTLVIGVFGCPEVEDRFADTLQLFTETVK